MKLEQLKQEMYTGAMRVSDEETRLVRLLAHNADIDDVELDKFKEAFKKAFRVSVDIDLNKFSDADNSGPHSLWRKFAKVLARGKSILYFKSHVSNVNDDFDHEKKRGWKFFAQHPGNSYYDVLMVK